MEGLFQFNLPHLVYLTNILCDTIHVSPADDMPCAYSNTLKMVSLRMFGLVGLDL